MVTTLSSPGPRDTEVVWAFLEGLFRHAPVWIAFFDRHASCVRVNAALAARNGKPAADHVGRGVREVFSSELGTGPIKLWRRGTRDNTP